VLRLEWGVEARRAGEGDLRLSDDATVANSSRWRRREAHRWESAPEEAKSTVIVLTLSSVGEPLGLSLRERRRTPSRVSTVSSSFPANREALARLGVRTGCELRERQRVEGR